MDKASLTIDRHTPAIPESIWCGLSPSREALYTTLKNQTILTAMGLSSTRKRARKVKPDTSPRCLTDEILGEGIGAYRQVAGKLSPDQFDYLRARGLDESEMVGFCSTEVLVALLPPETVANLTLRLPDKLLGFVETTAITGLTIPYWHGEVFCGFATRVLNHPQVKYAFSVPNRFCFGVDLSRDEVTVVEGLFDAIAVRRLGHNPLGMGDSQPNYFKMLVVSKFQKIRLLFDDDLAGWMGVLKAHAILTKMLGVSEEKIEICEVGGGHDPEQAVRLGRRDFAVVSMAGAKDRVETWRQWAFRNRG